MSTEDTWRQPRARPGRTGSLKWYKLHINDCVDALWNKSLHLQDTHILTDRVYVYKYCPYCELLHPNHKFHWLNVDQE